MNKNYSNPFVLSIAVHGLFFVALTLSNFLDSPQIIHAAGAVAAQQDKPIIQASVISNEAVKTAVARQEQQERDKQQRLAMQKANAEQLKKEAEKAKLEAKKLQQEVAVAKKKAEQEKQQAMVAKAAAEKAKLQAAKEQAKVKLAKEQVAKKLEKAKQEKLQAVKEREAAKKVQEQAAAEQARQAADRARQAAEQARAAQQLAERTRWIDSELSRYAGAIKQSIYNHRTLSSAFGPELVCKIQIKLLPEGSVHEVKIIQSSGNAAYDAMSEEAVYKAAPFDMAEDQELNARLRDIILEFTNSDNG
jgi:colicin import membrane protein